MVIKKYKQQQNTQEGIDTQVQKYQTKNQAFLKLAKSRKSSFLDRSKSTLATLLPLAAASLSPFVLQAQCITPTASNPSMSGCNNSDFTLDIDGGGADLAFVASPSGLYVREIGNSPSITFAVTPSGVYRYLIGYDGSTINSGSGNFGALQVSSGAVCGQTTTGQGVMETSFGGGAGAWLGGGNVTKSLGFIKGGKLGFVEITWNNTSSSPTVGAFGVVEDASTTTISEGDCSSLLPVELTKFEGTIKGETIHLVWETASETNNDGFEIQRSTDGRNFNKITWIEGAGTTAETVHYEFNDKDIKANETYYYRLKQVDYDGQFEYSGVLSLIYTDEGATTIKDFAPNPVQENHADLRIVSPLSQNATVSVFDAMGKVVYEKKTRLIKGLHTIRLDLVNASSGTHFVRINLENGESQFKKLVIAR